MYPWLLLEGELLNGATPDRLIELYEAWARDVLARAGLPTTLGLHRQVRGRWVRLPESTKRPDPRWGTLRSVLGMIESKSSVEWLAAETLLMAGFARQRLVEAKPAEVAFVFARMVKLGTIGRFMEHVEDDALRGFAVRTGAHGRDFARRRELQARTTAWITKAREIHARSPALSARAIAARIAKESGASAESIRKAIAPALRASAQREEQAGRQRKGRKGRLLARKG